LEEKTVVILGVTGSIGTQTVDVIKALKGFKVVGISFGRNVSLAEKIIDELGVKYYVSEREASKGVKIETLEELFSITEPDIVVCAIPGFEGVKAALESLKHTKRLALATKEALVCAGPFVKQLAEKYSVEIIPIDSEHSAIFQLYEPHIDHVLITASGGAVRDVPLDDIPSLTPAQILKHPTWSMGGRITVDSATMVNKLFEVIEAHELFNLDYSKIDVKLNRSSFVHGIVFLKDGVIKIHAGKPDMRIPIAYSLTYPERIYESCIADVKEFDLSLYNVEEERYPIFHYGLELARTQSGLSWRIALNASDEIAVEYFLREKITFRQIETVVKRTVDYVIEADKSVESINDVYEIDNISRNYAAKVVKELLSK